MADKLTDKIPPMPVAYYDFNIHNELPRSEHLVMAKGPTMTRQEFADECDINVLMKRYENQDIGAVMRRAGEPMYADFTEMPLDLQGYMDLMGKAQNAFMTLSAQVRREFDNDPIQFVDFASDPANLDQLRSWGLAPPAPEPPPAAAPPPAATPPPPAPGAVGTPTPPPKAAAQ